jgi:tetratricopeptide (TPR) repeat protein
VDCYLRAIKLDNYLAVAYFQQGVSNFLMGDFEEALANFNDTLLYLRGNNNIDYEQLGLKFKLFACEVLFNRGLCYIYLSQMDQGMQDLFFAAKEKVVPDHDVIDEAIKEQAEVRIFLVLIHLSVLTVHRATPSSLSPLVSSIDQTSPK